MRQLIFFFIVSVRVFSQNADNKPISRSFDYGMVYDVKNSLRSDFRGKRFVNVDSKDIEGKSFQSANSKDLVFYNFWQKNCVPCILEADMLNQLQSKFGKDVDFIGITYENKEEIEKFERLYPSNFRQLSISQSVITNLYLYSGYPASFLVYKGEIIEMSIGGSADSKSIYFYPKLFWTYSVFRKAIEEKLGEARN